MSVEQAAWENFAVHLDRDTPAGQVECIHELGRCGRSRDHAGFAVYRYFQCFAHRTRHSSRPTRSRRLLAGLVDDTPVHHCQDDPGLVDRVRVGFKDVSIEHYEICFLADFDRPDLVFHV